MAKVIQDAAVVLQNVIRLRDEAYEMHRKHPEHTDTQVMYLKLNSCLFRDADNKLKEAE